MLLLFLCDLFTLFETSIARSSKFVLEFFDSSSSVNKLELARIEWVARIADVDLQLFTSAPRDKAVATAAGDLGFLVIGMDASLHFKGSPPEANL